jgi:hypothetical protein
MVNHYNWATCNGLKEAGIEYWCIKFENETYVLYFKGKKVTNVHEFSTIQMVTSLVKDYIHEHCADDKDAKRFLKYIDDVIN